jgi:NADPH:quinone reductase-like Zn-dependent oxidoreductase
MKSYHAESGGGLASLVARSHPVPQPGPREVLVRVRANSLNARELSVLAGTYPLPVKPDVVMGADGAGEIVAAGQGVRGWAATVRVVFAGHRAHFAAMNRAIAVNRLRPIIDRAFPFEDVLGAFRYYETGQMFGKVVINHTPEAR